MVAEACQNLTSVSSITMLVTISILIPLIYTIFVRWITHRR
jgi:hypothetical protein